jgi:hypothetical protein
MYRQEKIIINTQRKECLKMKKMELNLEEMKKVSGGTGPLNYPYKGTGPLATCDPPKRTGPLGAVGPVNETGPLGAVGPVNYPY